MKLTSTNAQPEGILGHDQTSFSFPYFLKLLATCLLAMGLIGSASAQDSYLITFGNASITAPANQMANYGTPDYGNWGVTRNGLASTDLSFADFYNGTGTSSTVLAATAPLSTAEADPLYFNPSGQNYLYLEQPNSGFIIGNVPMLSDPASRTFTLSFGISGRGPGANGANLADLIIQYQNTSGVYVTIPTTSFVPNTPAVGEEWKFYQASITSNQIPANLSIRIYRTTNNGSKPLAFDDIRISNFATCNLGYSSGHNKVWVGAGSPYQTNFSSPSSFTNANNWCPAGVPNSTHSVLIESSSTSQIVIANNTSLAKLTLISRSNSSGILPLVIGNGALTTLTIGSGGLAVYGTSATGTPVAEIRTHGAGTLTVNGPTELGTTGNGVGRLASTSSLGGTINFNHQVTFGARAAINNNRPATIRFRRDVTNNCAGLDFGATNIEFTGTGAQAILGSEQITCRNMEVSAEEGVSLAFTDQNLLVSGHLKFVKGIFETGLNKVVFTTTASITESNTSFLNGNLELVPRIINTSLQNFGNLGLEVELPNTTSPYYAAILRKTGVPIINAEHPDFQSISKRVTITVSQAPGGDPVPANLDATMRLTFWGHEFSYSSLEDLVFYRKSPLGSGSWVNMGADNPGGIPTGTGPYTLTLSHIQAFSTWTIGQAFSPLPVHLVSFSAKPLGSDALLEWSTASEQSNAGYRLEAGVDNKHFEPIGHVPAAPVSTQLNNYQFTEKQAIRYSRRYYRLVQIDLDGTETILGVRWVNFRDTGTLLSAAPNPFEQTFTALVEVTEAQPATLTLTDALGRTISQQEVDLIAGTNQARFNNLSLSPGMYILNVQLPTGSLTHKLLRQ